MKKLTKNENMKNNEKNEEKKWKILEKNEKKN